MSKISASQIEACCSGKRDHRTYWQAHRVAKYLNRIRDGARCDVYRCDNCKHWHVGNTMRKNFRGELGVAI